MPGSVRSEIVVVDDNSPDGTARILRDYIEHHQDMMNQAIRVVVREARMGLSSAILTGVRNSSGQFVVVMDADLSHPPSLVPSMITALLSEQYDVVVASRNVRGGRVVGWSPTRKMASRIGTQIAGGLGLRTKDPLSGFFAFNRRVIEGIKFDAMGYKILTEILAKSRGARVKEIPYTFTNRRAGESKLSPKVILDYLRMSWRLYWFTRRRRAGER